MERTERIMDMEYRLDDLKKVTRELSRAWEAFVREADDMAKLEDYLGSDEWHADRQADADGLLPEGLRRGVLSEDGIWNLLEERKELLDEIKDTITKSKRK